jgi:isoleucyl-tRNA synthetase
VINQIKALAITTSNGQVVREFEEWALENQHEEFRGKPLTAFLRSRSSERVSTREAVEHPVVKAVGREISYITGNLVALDPKHKAILKEAVEEEDYTVEEVLSAFREFFQNLDTTNQNKMSYAALNFVNEASDRLYTVRRKHAERVAQDDAVSRKAAEMQAEAERERVERAVAKQKEQELVEEELPD